MVNKLEKTKKDEATIVGIILIGIGSSWYQGTDEVKVGVQCAKMVFFVVRQRTDVSSSKQSMWLNR